VDRFVLLKRLERFLGASQPEDGGGVHRRAETIKVANKEPQGNLIRNFPKLFAL
jgi:hypothetical protein